MWFTPRKRFPVIKILHIQWRSSGWSKYFSTSRNARYPRVGHGCAAGLAPATSALEQLGINVSERLEFQCIITWVHQYHRGLFAREPRESCIGFDDEAHIFSSERSGERIPLIHLQHDAKMRYRDCMPVNRITVCSGAIPIPARWSKMADQLMSIKIEIHPGAGTAPLRAAQQPRVEITRRRDIIYPDGQMERWHICEITGCLAGVSAVTRVISGRSSRATRWIPEA